MEIKWGIAVISRLGLPNLHFSALILSRNVLWVMICFTTLQLFFHRKLLGTPSLFQWKIFRRATFLSSDNATHTEANHFLYISLVRIKFHLDSAFQRIVALRNRIPGGFFSEHYNLHLLMSSVNRYWSHISAYTTAHNLTQQSTSVTQYVEWTLGLV